jgi:AraC-like DNA-binding protein
MLSIFDVMNIKHFELNMYHCDTADCKSGHYYGPAVRDFYLIHYILKGKGTFQVGDRVYKLEKGQGFLICPGKVTFYKADEIDPWSYSWVGFNGMKAEAYLKLADLTQDNPIFQYEDVDYLKDFLNRMIAARQLKKNSELQLLGMLYLFLAELIGLSNTSDIFENMGDRKELYVKKAVEYISMNYSRKVRISEMAGYIGLDRSYLCSIFKSVSGLSPQEFLINLRVNKACELMLNEDLTIGDISRSVGYDDQLLFSKTFTKIKGQSPREFRKSIQESISIPKNPLQQILEAD